MQRGGSARIANGHGAHRLEPRIAPEQVDLEALHEYSDVVCGRIVPSKARVHSAEYVPRRVVDHHVWVEGQRDNPGDDEGQHKELITREQVVPRVDVARVDVAVEQRNDR